MSAVFDANEDYGNELSLPARCLLRGASTMAEAATKLRDYAEWIDLTAAEGWELVKPIDNAYFGVCRKVTRE